MTSGLEQWDAEECADATDMEPGTWRSMVSRGQAPARLPGHRPSDGRVVWSRATVLEWQANRAGRGARTDIRSRSLRECTDPYYMLGRLIGLASVIVAGADPPPRAVTRMIDTGVVSRVRIGMLVKLAQRHVVDGTTVRRELLEELAAVADVCAGVLTSATEMKVQLGYHHQRGALLGR